jgi:hypothetical protein
MSVQLKIKSKHLSQEASIIRFEERKLLKNIAYHREQHNKLGMNSQYDTDNDSDYRSYISLNGHRRNDVRNENRATFLARAFIAGMPYNAIENKRNNDALFKYIILPRVIALICKYGRRHETIWKDDGVTVTVWDYKSQAYKPTDEFRAHINQWCNC